MLRREFAVRSVKCKVFGLKHVKVGAEKRSIIDRVDRRVRVYQYDHRKHDS